jgi:hypothetical protein
MHDTLDALACVAAGQRYDFNRFEHAAPLDLVRVVDWMLQTDPSARPEPLRAARALSQLAYEQRATEWLASRVRRHANAAQRGSRETPKHRSRCM